MSNKEFRENSPRDKLIREMLNEKADDNNIMDLEAYGIGLIDMYEKIFGK